MKRLIKGLIKYKTSTLLTLISLVISFLGIIVIVLYVSFEKSFDTFHANKELIYRFETLEYGCWVPAVIDKIIVENVPEVDKLVVCSFDHAKVSTPELAQQNQNFETSMLYADSSFFDIFSFDVIYGEPISALSQANCVVLTQTLSGKLFGAQNPVGQIVLFNNEEFKVTGLMADFPKNSSIKSGCVASIATYRKHNRSGVNEWSEWSFNIYVKLNSGVNTIAIADKIAQIPVVAEVMESMSERHKGEAFFKFRPITDIHYVNMLDAFEYVNPVMIKIWVLLAIILAVMGAVNFINFATSQAPVKAKSLSVTQVMGATRLGAMSNIISESVILSVLAMLLSVFLYLGLYKFIETGWQIQGLHLTGRYVYLLWFFGGAVVFGLLAGLYPARYITSSPLAQAVKGKPHFMGKGKLFRNVLVTLQFVFTIALIASVIVIEKQLNFWRNFDLGIKKEQVVFMPTTDALRQHYQAFADELLKNNNIDDYTYSQFIPGQVNMGWGRVVDGQYIQLKSWPVDHRFIDFFGIKISQGRKFIDNSQADINTFILNKKGVDIFEWDNPLERQIPGFGFVGQVVGVAENFIFSSLKDEVEPLAFWLTDTRKYYIMLRVKPDNYLQTALFIKNTANKFDPKNQFEVKFLDESLNKLYDKEEKMAHFIVFVAIWCVLLAVTGLLGLIIFICRDRVKEIGIRKVNGAKITEVVTMINKDIIGWVLIAFIIATPVTYYAMQKWLQGFAYKTQLSWWIFILAGVVAIVVALLTVSWQSIKAAGRNPVEALRYE